MTRLPGDIVQEDEVSERKKVKHTEDISFGHLYSNEKKIKENNKDVLGREETFGHFDSELENIFMTTKVNETANKINTRIYVPIRSSNQTPNLRQPIHPSPPNIRYIGRAAKCDHPAYTDEFQGSKLRTDDVVLSISP
ncbi:hypothetical protein RF11_15613 [Thelohanellus kitauei]|uniref:Uncharacterized protein n=1 Tax=Thelohanellus kitauei TaxID=669202 RepID=A0A0C2N2M8_THEKT|nr:hypothetical protein RF11_15613 [Thelohanellus kitauei]